MKLSDTHVRGHIAALIAVTIWGGAFVAAQVALQYVKPTELMCIRILLGILATTCVHPKPLGWLGWKQERYYLLAAALGVTFYYFFQNMALTYSSASNVAVLCSLAPLVTGLAAPLLQKAPRPRGWFYVGCALAVIGSALTVYNGSAVLQLNPIGDAMALVVAVIWGLYAIVSRKITSFGHKLIPTTRKMLVYALILALPLTLAFGVEARPADLAHWDLILASLYLGVGGSCLCYLLWSYAIYQLGSVRTSTYVYLEPLVTMAVAAALLGDKITWIALLGAACIIVGLLLTERRGKRQN